MRSWNSAKLPYVGPEYWEHLAKQQAFIHELGKTLKITHLVDWYNVPSSTISQYGGYGLLVRYNGSMTNLLTAVYPEYLRTIFVRIIFQMYKWDKTRFTSETLRFQGYWDHFANQRSFMKNLAKKLGITSDEGWYTVTTKLFHQHGGQGLLNKYNNSVIKLLSAIFPQYLTRIVCYYYSLRTQWYKSKFVQARQRQGDGTDQQRLFIDDLAKKLQITNKEDWYKVTNAMLVSQSGGAKLLNAYNGSLSKLLSTVYPEYPWDALQFQHVPKRHWFDKNNQRMFMESVAKKLSILVLRSDNY